MTRDQRRQPIYVQNKEPSATFRQCCAKVIHQALGRERSTGSTLHPDQQTICAVVEIDIATDRHAISNHLATTPIELQEFRITKGLVGQPAIQLDGHDKPCEVVRARLVKSSTSVYLLTKGDVSFQEGFMPGIETTSVIGHL